jgi:hypothetical protein
MLESRRELLLGIVSAAGLLTSAALLALEGGQYPPPRPTPPASNPGTMSGAPKPSPRVISSKNQELLKDDIDQLYELAYALKKEYQAADPNAVLSVSFVKKAEQAEKLAKQVKNLARGSA